ncbi:RNA polymerase sigma factor [Plantactinospora sp. KBS50]|uniref:RNA polymerase sigma factor n=1 Tax=Plantactinospora sp. KBS50 TaxID=2024580 RepID=UPI000BAADAEB|nr:sigma-70 family RNA polymerase sigma factor [Plantactinospora sp. KBS50]ASW55546.1 hypothetical protein CIK06_17245 [Plantactinospora sp. KBS50]
MTRGMLEGATVDGLTDAWDTAARDFAAWRTGDRAGLDRLVRQMTPVLWHIARAYGLDPQTAEDAVQTTWLALVRNADSVRDPQAVWRWATTTVRREAWRLARAQRQEDAADPARLNEIGPVVPGPEEQVLSDDAARSLWQQVARLPERCRRLLRVIAFDDRPDYATLSNQLAIPIGSIGPTRGRCLDKLRRALAGDPRRRAR